MERTDPPGINSPGTNPTSHYPAWEGAPTGDLRPELSVSGSGTKRAPKPLCRHTAGHTFNTKRGLVLRWCSRKNCGALGIKNPGERTFCWAQPGERGEEMVEEIVERARRRAR
jgi:hypothetical protein